MPVPAIEAEMSLIQVSDLRKEFRVPVRKDGRFGAIRSLFSREYEVKTAVDDITFTINKGETVGYVGPNGAGKSTTIKMLTGILVPTSGTVEVAGLTPHRQRNERVRHIGAVFGQKTQLWWDVPVIDSLVLLKDIYKIPDAVYRANLELFRDLLDLHTFQKTAVRQLSLGQRMRADLAAALLHSPDILFLDEPTIGIDVVAKERFRKFIASINRELQTTVLLTTHDMSDIERICQRIIMIEKGKIIYDGALTEMKKRFMPHHFLRVELAETAVTDQALASLMAEFDDGIVQIDSMTGSVLRLQFERERLSAADLIAHLVQYIAVKDIHIEEPDTETIVRELYEAQTVE